MTTITIDKKFHNVLEAWNKNFSEKEQIENFAKEMKKLSSDDLVELQIIIEESMPRQNGLLYAIWSQLKHYGN